VKRKRIENLLKNKELEAKLIKEASQEKIQIQNYMRDKSSENVRK